MPIISETVPKEQSEIMCFSTTMKVLCTVQTYNCFVASPHV